MCSSDLGPSRRVDHDDSVLRTPPKTATLLAMKSEAEAPPTGDITPATAGDWLSMVARVTGYGVTLNDAVVSFLRWFGGLTDMLPERPPPA